MTLSPWPTLRLQGHMLAVPGAPPRSPTCAHQPNFVGHARLEPRAGYASRLVQGYYGVRDALWHCALLRAVQRLRGHGLYVMHMCLWAVAPQ